MAQSPTPGSPDESPNWQSAIAKCALSSPAALDSPGAAVAHSAQAAAHRHTSTWPPPARLTIEAKGIHSPGPFTWFFAVARPAGGGWGSCGQGRTVMTRARALKQVIRARAAKTGERYTTARRHVSSTSRPPPLRSRRPPSAHARARGSSPALSSRHAAIAPTKGSVTRREVAREDRTRARPLVRASSTSSAASSQGPQRARPGTSTTTTGARAGTRKASPSPTSAPAARARSTSA